MRQRNESFYQIEKGKEVYHLPIDGFDGDIHDGEYCMSLECDYSKKTDVKEDQKELQELTYEIDKEVNEALGKPIPKNVFKKSSGANLENTGKYKNKKRM